ncbi:MAG: hypothetical protein KDD51_14295, partial [Bdellovibrionales bacterium]|nr:hypothetical protein [Bdellovibrionales bacterium]
MRRLGIKALFSELATANFFLPTKDRVALPDACVNAGDIQDYVSFFNRTNTVQARELEAEKLANAVEHLERDYLSGATTAPIPAIETAAPLYARAHQILSTLILNQATYLTQQNSGKAEKLRAIQKEQADSLSRMAAVPIYQRLRESAMEVGDSYASILAYKLRLFAALIQEDFAKVEGDLASPQKRAVLDNMVRTVVLEALVDFAETYLASLMVDSKEFKVQDLVLAWQQVGKPQWRQALESPEMKGELAKNARELTDTLFSYPEIRASSSADQKADELVAAQVKRFAPSMMDAALADIPGARAASEIPTPTGEGWQSPVFHLDPYKPLDYQHLKKGLQHMARGYEAKLAERLEADPRFRDPVWLQRNFHQVVYHPDGKSETVKVESAKVLARAIVEKFIETSDADPLKDFDWSAKSRVAILEPLKSWLIDSSKDAKKVYEKERKEFASVLFTRYLYPLILNRAKTDEGTWRTHFATTLEQIDKRDIIVPFRNKPVDRAQKIVEAYDNSEKAKKTAQQSVAVVQNLISERPKADSDLNVEKATITSNEGGPAKNFTDYVAKHKDADETKSALRWLIPVKPENKALLLAFYEGRLQTVVPPLAKDILGYFGPGKMVYPGKEKLEELADNDDKADDALVGTKNARKELFNAVWGSVGSLTKEGKAFEPTVDALLVGILKTLSEGDNAKKSQDALIALFTEQFTKKVKASKWDEAWFTRVSQAGDQLRKAIESDDAAEMATVFPLWIQLVGLEYQKLNAGLNYAVASLQKQTAGNEFKDKTLPELILPPFEDFRFALLNYMITLTTPQAAHIYPNEPLRNPYEQVAKLTQQLEDLEFSISGDKELKGDDLAEVIKVRSHVKYMIERARHQIAATENLKRVLRVYLPSNGIALGALARLDAGSYQEIWNAYYQDQFLDTFEAADRTKMPMSPSQILKDLNEIAKSGAGVMDVSFFNAETHLKELREYCKAGSETLGVAAFRWNYRKSVGALVWQILSRPTAFVQFQNGENLSSPDVKAVAAAVEKLLRLRTLNVGVKRDTVDGWLKSILVIAANPENWMDLPSPAGWCQAISSRAEALENKLKTHTEELKKRKTVPTVLPVNMAREYGELVELSSDILHGAGSTFGPLAKGGDKGEPKSAAWFSIGPYVNFYVPEPKKAEETEEAGKDESDEQPPKAKQADVVTATKGLVAFANLDLDPVLYENIGGVEGPSITAKKFFAAQSRELRVMAVQSMTAKDRVELFAAVKSHLWELIRNPSPTDQFSPKPKVVPGTPQAETPKEGSESQPSEPSGTKESDTTASNPDEGKELDTDEQGSDESDESETTQTEMETVETAEVEQVEKKDEALLALKDKVPAELYALAEKDPQNRALLLEAMKIERIAGKVTSGELKDYLAIAAALRDWPIDQYASSPSVSQELLKDAKKSTQFRNIFKLAMNVPRLKQLVIEGKMPSMNELRIAYQRSLYLFSASQAPSAEYKEWRDKLTQLFVLWTELKQKDPKWGLESSALFAELSLELFERYFRYLPYQLRGRTVELVDENVAKIGYFKSLEAFRGLPVTEQVRVIDKIRSMYFAEIAAASEEVFAKERARVAGLREFGEEVSGGGSVLLEVSPYGEARPVSYKKPEGEEVGSAYAKLLLFYSEYFSDAAIPALSTAARSIEDWRGHCERRAKDEAPVYTTFYDQYLFSWGPIGQKLNERERFETWVEALVSRPEVNAAFAAKAGKEVPKWASKRIWKLSKTLKEFVASDLYKQVGELLSLFDENAKAKPEPHTYPFFLALVNWKTNPKRYGIKPHIADSPQRKPWQQRALENSSALVTGSPNPSQYLPERADGLVPEPSPMMQYHIAGLMKDLVDEMGIDLKKFDGWETVLDRTADEVHTIVASSKRFGLVGVKSARFANTSVPTITSENANLGPDFETRFFPVIPAQRSSFLPADSFEEYAAMIDRPATYLRYQVNTGDQDNRPLYKQMASVQTRMVGLSEISDQSANKRSSYSENRGNWSNYTFGGNPVVPEVIKNKVVQRAEAAGVKGVDGAEVARLILIRERYVDLLEKMSQTVSKYPGEPGKYTQRRGNTVLLSVGGFASKTADTVTFGSVTSGGGAAELDRMLKSYASTMGWTGTLVTCKRGPSHRWVANAVWQAGVITQWKVEQGLEKDQVTRQRHLLTVIDNTFSEAVQGIEYRKAVKVVTGNIVPRLEKLCSADRLKFTRTDEEFE